MKQFIICLMLIVILGTALHGTIPANERAALIALYNATNGDDWKWHAGWKKEPLEADGFGAAGTEGDWLGINVEDGHVVTVTLFKKNLNGTIPPEIGDLRYLRTLSLYDNRLSGPLPPEFCNLTELTYCHIGGNQISGTIPACLGQFTDLGYLNLGPNDFTGTIPSELGKLTQLYALILSENQLTGSIPPELGNLTDTHIIAMSNNQLSGSIPPEFGKCVRTLDLYLDGNQLTGAIPVEISNMAWLAKLGLENNRLSGEIPSELGNIDGLITLDLSSNQLRGEIPSTFVNLVNLDNRPLETGFAYNLLYTSDPAVKQFMDSVDTDWEYTQTLPPTDIVVTSPTDSSLRVTWNPIGAAMEGGYYRLYYSLSSSGAWTLAGETENKSVASMDITGLITKTRYYIKMQTHTDAHGSNQSILTSDFSPVVSGITGTAFTEIDPPFGSFDTPLEGAYVMGSIAVTGWALDDSGVDHVKIYRHLGTQSIYIGDAIFVEGARPDVVAAYPGYPANTSAGWGYMLLTNFLPNSGNGSFVLEAIATDMNGKTTSLGTRTINCDNENAIKPFGALDTPSQGGIASGSEFLVWGWALTPMPNAIPTDGSTIDVWVDGKNLGHPIYNLYRSDIANLFPSYANSEGAVGYFYLDTTTLDNGVHTIQWTVKDNADNFDGIGSRYFTVNNVLSKQQSVGSNFIPWKIRKGYNLKQEPKRVYPDKKGNIIIEIKALQRFEIHLPAGTRNVNPLPIGAFLSDDGTLSWQLGPGYLGFHPLSFVVYDDDGVWKRKNILVSITK
jgi:fibronectin type III domain protein/Leucine Rich Repeat (LRR) protein